LRIKSPNFLAGTANHRSGNCGNSPEFFGRGWNRRNRSAPKARWPLRPGLASTDPAVEMEKVLRSNIVRAKAQSNCALTFGPAGQFSRVDDKQQTRHRYGDPIEKRQGQGRVPAPRQRDV